MTEPMTSPLEDALAQRDLVTVDQGIARAFKKLAAFRERLFRGEKDLADPLAQERAITGKKAFDRLTELLKNDELAREGARRHIAELCLFRLARETEEELSQATHTSFELLTREKTTSTFSESSFAILREHDDRERRAHLDLLTRAAIEIEPQGRERAATRVEASARLGLPHPVAYATEVPLAAIEEGARAFLTRTESLFFDVIARRARKNERAWSLFDALDLACAIDANEGWPARLTQAWFRDALPALANVAPHKNRELPMLGASTFLRDLAKGGEELREHTAPKSLMFIVAHDPYPRAAYRLGQTCALLGMHAEFHKRALGLSPGPARDQSAKLAESALLQTRVLAMRTLFAVRAPAASEFEEHSRAAFGAPLDPKLRGAWPLPKLDVAPRFIALLEARDTFDELVQRFDEDWFRNPRAGREIMSRAAGPMRDVPPQTELLPGVARLVTAFEQALK